MGDKAYSSNANRAYLRRRGIKAVIPVKKDQAANRTKLGSKGGRPPAFDRERYKERNTVERCVNKLRQHCAVATRYDKDNSSTRAPLMSPRSAFGFEIQLDDHFTPSAWEGQHRHVRDDPTGLPESSAFVGGITLSTSASTEVIGVLGGPFTKRSRGRSGDLFHR